MNDNFSAPSLPGILLVGHGTRDAAGLAEFREVGRRLADRLAPQPVEACFLELAEPRIEVGVRQLVERGVGEVVVVPALLFEAGHAKRDIPEAVTDALRDRDDIAIRHAAPLGCEPRIVALSRRRHDEATSNEPTLPDEPAAAHKPETTQLILVGRGSSDPEAIADMHSFARRRAVDLPGVVVTVAFADVAEPRLEAALEAAGCSEFRRIIIQPHLLFSGQLVRRVAQLVDDARRRHPTHQWLLTRHLGAEPEVVEALAARAAGG